MHFSIWLKFRTLIKGLKKNINIKFGLNPMNILKVMKGFMHKTKSNFCQAYRLNWLEKQVNNQYVNRIYMRRLPFNE